MTNKISLLVLLVASQLMVFAQDAPKKNNFYLGTLPSVSNKFDQNTLASNLFLRNNQYTKTQFELDQGLEEHFNHLVVPILLVAELKNSLAIVVDSRFSAFNYEANININNPSWTDKNGFRKETVSGYGLYQYTGIGKAFRFLENKNLMILPHVGVHNGIVSSDYISSSKLNGNDNRNHYSNYNSYYGVQSGVIINLDLSKRFALGLNLNNVIGIQFNEESRGIVLDYYTYYGLSSEFSNNNFYLAFKF
ncbi:MAG: hypothetical protein Q8R57_12585 [Bacteroidota bacterium]|nr:hypothetical protein [Bacteroidota bacterium]